MFSMLKVEPASLRNASGWSRISSGIIYSDPIHNKPEEKQL